MQGADQLERRLLGEHDHTIDGIERREEPGALGRGDVGPVAAFSQPPRRRVVIHSHDQRLTLGARRFEEGDVPDVQHVEHAIGEHDRTSLRRPPRGGGASRPDLARGVQSGSVALGCRWKVCTKSGSFTVSAYSVSIVIWRGLAERVIWRLLDASSGSPIS